MADIYLKILLIGDTSVGKTSILCKYIDDEFSDTYLSTIGIEFKIKSLIINGKKVLLRIWDTSGQERYRSITQNFYRNANGILFIFDITKKETFDNIKIWLTDSENCEDNKVAKMLIGNKIDLENKRKIDNETIKKFAEKKEMKYFEASAKEGINIDNIFRELAELILFNKSKEENEEETIRNRNRENSFNLSFDSIEPIKKKTCC
jgi:Ras-related protein Rab-1A